MSSQNKPASSPSKKAKDRRAQQIEQQQRNQRMLLGVVAVVFLVGVIVAIFMATRPPEATLPTTLNDHYAEIHDKNLQGVTDQGFPFIGAADAPSTIEEFGSFSCPHCAEYHDGMFESLLDKFKNGQAKLVFIPITNIGAFDATTETLAAACVAQQGKFWELNDVLFSWQGLYGTGAGDPARIRTGVQGLGLDMGKYDSCMNSNVGKDLIKKAADEATKRGVNVTPTIFFNGQQLSPNPADPQGSTPTLSQMRGLIEAAAAKKS